MQNRIALNRSVVSVWILLFISSAMLALGTNPIIGVVAGIACGVYFVQWQRRAPSPNWTDTPWVRVVLPLAALGASVLFIVIIVFAVRIISNFGPVR